MKRRIGLILDTKYGHYAIADEPVDKAAISLDNISYLDEISVEQVHQVLGR